MVCEIWKCFPLQRNQCHAADVTEYARTSQRLFR